uniref:Uncharacterized protein n=1 Tax=Panagrolaimus davidi TaxID=227884 RepID=A0A914PMZ4_9BILA
MIKEGNIVQIETLKLPAKTKYVLENGIYITPNIETNTKIPLKVSDKPIYFDRIKENETVKDETLLKLSDDTKESWEEVAKALEAAATAVKVKEKISIKETSLKNVNLEWKITRNDAVGTFNSHIVTSLWHINLLKNLQKVFK